jgi:hypothetical protein
MVAITNTVNKAFNHCEVAAHSPQGQDKLATLATKALDAVAEALKYLGRGDKVLFGRISAASTYFKELADFSNFFNFLGDIKEISSGNYFVKAKEQDDKTSVLFSNLRIAAESLRNFTSSIDALRERAIVALPANMKGHYEKIAEYALPILLSIDFVKNAYDHFMVNEDTTGLLNSSLKIASFASETLYSGPVSVGLNAASAMFDFYNFTTVEAV